MPARAFTEAKGSKIFFSSIPDDGKYYNRDSELRDQLEKGMSALRRQELITIWHDGKLSGGRIREQEITDHLEAAEIILLLLSSEFLASDFCYTQMQHAMKKHEKGEALVIPVFLRPTDGWEELPFGRLMPLPTNEMFYPFEPDKEPEWCYKVAKGLRSLVIDRYSLVLPLADPVSTQPRTYRDTLITSPPALFSTSIIQRTKQVEEIYQHLTQDAHTALIMTGLGGSGKSVLAAQVYAFVEKLQHTGQGSFSGKPLWFHIDEKTTLMDVVGSLCSILGRPLLPFKEFAERELPAKDLARELFHIVKNSPRLIIFDQFETWLAPQTGLARLEHRVIDEWLDLLNTSPQACAGRILLISRFYPHGVLHQSEHVQEYNVSGLEVSESIQLLRMGNIPATAQATNKELSTLAERCQGHAQTLAWLHELFKRDASLTLSDLLHQPHYENWWIGVRTFEMLKTIYAHYLNQEQRELLLAFSVYREAVPFEAALAITEPVRRKESRWSADVQLVLLDLGLLQAPGNGLYSIHPVAADFVRAYFEKKDRYKWIEAHSRAARYYQNRFQDSSSLERTPHDE